MVVIFAPCVDVWVGCCSCDGELSSNTTHSFDAELDGCSADGSKLVVAALGDEGN